MKKKPSDQLNGTQVHEIGSSSDQTFRPAEHLACWSTARAMSRNQQQCLALLEQSTLLTQSLPGARTQKKSWTSHT